MSADVDFFIQFFSLTLPFFTALTGVAIIVSSYVNSCNSAVRMLNKRLLALLLSLMGVWAGLFMYFFAPKMILYFFPVYAMSTLCVPVCLYAFIHSLIYSAKGKPLGAHYVTPAMLALAMSVFSYTSQEHFAVTAATLSPLSRLLFSTTYAAMSLHLLWQEYRSKRQSGEKRLLPSRWLLTLVMLVLIQLTNSVIIVFGRSAQTRPLIITIGALLISTLITVLLYNTICRSIDLFRVRRKQKNYTSKKANVTKHPKKQTVVVNHLGISRQQFEHIFVKEKLHLNPKLTLAAACERLETNRTYLSNFINRVYGMNFSQYVNFYRLKELERLRALPSNAKASVGKLCVKAGFRNYHHYRGAMKENEKKEVRGEVG